MESYKKSLAFNEAIKHILLKTSYPLEASYNVKLLWYRKLYLKDKVLFLVNEERFREIAFKRRLWHSPILHHKLRLLDESKMDNEKTFYKYLWYSSENLLGLKMPDTTLLPKQLNENMSQYNKLSKKKLWSGMSVYYKTDAGVETFAFYNANSSTQLEDLFHNNFWVIKRFILFFSQSLHKYIININDDVLLNSSMNVNKFRDNNIITKRHREFLSQTKLKNIRLIVSHKEYTLTYKEAECLFLLSQGKTSKEIARKLGNSPRTIDTHIDRIKIKLGVNTKADLLEAYFKSNLNEYFLINLN